LRTHIQNGKRLAAYGDLARSQKIPHPRIPSRNAHPTHPGWQGALSNSRLYERESAIVVCELLRFRGPPFGAIRLRRNGSARPRFPRVVYGDLIIPFLHRDTPRI